MMVQSPGKSYQSSEPVISTQEQETQVWFYKKAFSLWEDSDDSIHA